MVVTLFIVLCFLNLIHGQSNSTVCSRIMDPSGSGKWYDLSALDGREFVLSDAFSFYKVSLCKDAYPDCGRCGAPAGYCQWTENWNDCIGKFTTANGLADVEGVTMLYDNGDWGNVGRVTIECDPEVEDVSEPVPSPNPKSIKLYSKHACLVGPTTPVSDCANIPDPSGSGAIYNLSPIVNHQLFWAQPAMDYFFKASICASSFLDCNNCGIAGMCRYNTQGNDCIGRFDRAVGIADRDGVDLIYNSGGATPGRVRILCDPEVSLSNPTYDTDPLQVTVRSKYACKCSWVCVAPY